DGGDHDPGDRHLRRGAGSDVRSGFDRIVTPETGGPPFSRSADGRSPGAQLRQPRPIRYLAVEPCNCDHEPRLLGQPDVTDLRPGWFGAAGGRPARPVRLRITRAPALPEPLLRRRHDV